jgi:PAS domain S-box-containing protein
MAVPFKPAQRSPGDRPTVGGGTAGGSAGGPILHKGKTEVAPALFRVLAEGALYRTTFDQADVPLALLDAASEGRPIVQINRAFLDYFGVSEADALGSSLPQLVLHGDKDAERSLFAASGATRVRLRTTHRDGTSLYVEVRVNPLRDAGGKRTHWLVTFFDRGEAEQLRAEIARLKGSAAV